MTPLSVVIITFNEEKNLKRCLLSVQDLADELIIVDSFSTDKTKEIALQFNCKFIERAWNGYSDQKNYANSLAQNEYILSLDSDEEIGETLFKSIQTIKVAGINGSYSLNRLTNYCGHWIRYGGWYPDSKVRVFPKKETIWEGGYVHETLKLPSRINKETLEGDLLHYSYYSYADHKKRANKYSKLSAEHLYAEGKRVSPIKPYLSGIAKFLSMYLFNLGILDGKMGLIIAWVSASASVNKYLYLLELQLKTKL